MKMTLTLLAVAIAAALMLFAITPEPADMPADTPAKSPATPDAAPIQDAASLRNVVPVWNAEQINSACEQTLADAHAEAASLAELPIAEANVETVLHRWDAMAIDVENVLGPIYLLAYTHPEKAPRDAGQACIVEITNLQTELFQNSRLHALVSAIQSDDPIDQKLKADLIKQFEDTGVSLPEDRRQRAKEILQAVAEKSQEFQKHLRENREKLRFTPAEQKGLPENYLAKIERDGDDLLVGFDYPEAYPFLTYAEDGMARERMYRGFLNRGGKRNLELLQKITELRRELAGLYDLPSYAHYVTRRYMSGSPQAVMDFLDEVAGTVREVEQADVEMLRREKADHLGLAVEAVNVDPWDKQYYLERLRQQRFDVDQEALRKYFPTKEAVAWALDVTGRLYSIRILAQPGTAVWDPDVLYYDVHDADSGDFLGGLYLDLYPREGKYGHAAAFPIRGSSTLAGRKPVTALVTNFDRKGLTQVELETLLHELGHAVHGVLSNTRYVSHAGTTVERDFVEAPSQMYEEWAQRMQTLERMREFCAQCPVIEQELVDRIDAASRLGKGIHYGRQLLYARYDMALAGETLSAPQALWEKMESRTPMGHAKDTEFPGTFGHIAGGYAAGYYGYMWSETLAMDFVSAFGDNLLDPVVGHRFRDTVLSRGSEVPASDMARQFLGREPSPEAFFREIAGKGN